MKKVIAAYLNTALLNKQIEVFHFCIMQFLSTYPATPNIFLILYPQEKKKTHALL